MKRLIKKIFFAFITIAFFVFIYWWGGNAPDLKGFVIADSNIDNTKQTINVEKATSHDTDIEVTDDFESKETKEDNILPEKDAEVKKELSNEDREDEKEREIILETECDKSEYDKEAVSITENTYSTCTISVRCDTVFLNRELIDETLLKALPENGVILEPVKVIFYERESVFDVLLRVLNDKGIHMEFVDTPMFNSTYIEGISNLYEFDCGELSGWMYKVNDYFPDYGSSQYMLNDGDIVEWVYTCNRGKDVGDTVGE